MNEKLRKECKMLKALQNISYKKLAGLLGIANSSFYNWMKGYYDFSYKRQCMLWNIIKELKESKENAK